MGWDGEYAVRVTTCASTVPATVTRAGEAWQFPGPRESQSVMQDDFDETRNSALTPMS
jgi:hypothetical protein